MTFNIKKTHYTSSYILCFFVLSTLLSCKKNHEKVYEVPPIIQPYIDEFITQAAIRGVDLSIEDLIVELESGVILDGDEKAGLCTYGSSSRTPLIELDTTSNNWTLNDYTREQLVFHELGHCILGQQGHRNNRLDNGNYASYMRADGTPIYGRMSAFKKEYYLDEIFDRDNTTQPTWATEVPGYGSVQSFDKQYFLDEDFNDNSGGWDTNANGSTTKQITGGNYVLSNNTDGPKIASFNVNQLNDNINFEIEVGLEIPNSEVNYGLILWGLTTTLSGFLDDSYYYGYSNDTYVDVGDFKSQSFYNEPKSVITPYQTNKLTIRHIGDFYYIYVNEQVFDVLTYESLPSKLLAFYVSPQTDLKVDYISVSKLNN